MTTMSTRMFATGLMMLGVLGAIGCAAPPVPEKSGATTQKLLAPRAIVRTGTSPKTRATLGVYEWRVHKGISEFIVTGYDKQKKPVQGFSIAFSGKKTSQKPAVKIRVLDGKKFSANYDFHAADLNGQLSAKARQFLVRAAADFTTVAKFAPVSGGVSRKSAGLHFLGEAAPAGCARNAGKFIAGGVGCVVGAATAETGAGAVLAGSACYLAADSALDFLTSCYGGNGTPTDPNSANTFCDPGGSGFCSSYDTGASSSGDTGAGDAAGDPSGNNQSEDPGALSQANDDTGQENPSPEQGSQEADSASNESTCASCQGESSDLDVNDQNGDVQLGDQGGDYGGGSEGDYGGDQGGGEGDYGGDQGGDYATDI
jgi:hypothetical protein